MVTQYQNRKSMCNLSVVEFKFKSIEKNQLEEINKKIQNLVLNFLLVKEILSFPGSIISIIILCNLDQENHENQEKRRRRRQRNLS